MLEIKGSEQFIAKVRAFLEPQEPALPGELDFSELNTQIPEANVERTYHNLSDGKREEHITVFENGATIE